MRLAISTILFVFAFWAVVYAIELSSNRPSPSTQVGLMRSFLLFGKESESDVNLTSSPASATYVTVYRAPLAAPAREPVAARVAGVESQIDESDYQTDKRFKEQYRTLAATQNDVSSLKSTTAPLPRHSCAISSRLGSA